MMRLIGTNVFNQLRNMEAFIDSFFAASFFNPYTWKNYTNVLVDEYYRMKNEYDKLLAEQKNEKKAQYEKRKKDIEEEKKAADKSVNDFIKSANNLLESDKEAKIREEADQMFGKEDSKAKEFFIKRSLLAE